MKYLKQMSLALLLNTGISANAQKNKVVLPAPTAAQGAEFLLNNKTADGVITTPSGLQYKIIVKGTGNNAGATSKVSIRYNISLVNGKKMFSTAQSGWVHPINKALPGMQEALVMMNPGSKWVLYLPDALAFGREVFGGVPAGSAMICELELLEIIQKEAD